MTTIHPQGSGFASRMPLRDLHLWQFRSIRDLSLIAFVALAMYVCFQLRGVLVPIAIGFVAAYTVNPVLHHAERAWKFSRIRMLIIIDIVLAVFATAVFLLLAPRMISELERLIDKAPVYTDAVTGRLHTGFGEKWLERFQHKMTQLPEGSSDIMGLAMGGAKYSLSVLIAALGNIFYVISAVALIPFYFNFFAWKFDSIEAAIRNQIPSRHRTTVLRIGKRMDTAIGQFLRGRLLVVAAMMTLFSMAFWIAGVPYWFLLGCLTGILNFVPFFAFVGCVAAVLVTWIDAVTSDSTLSWTSILLWPILAYAVVQIMEGWILTPWIQSQSMHMNAVTVIMILMIGGAIGGIWGLLLALPVFDCLRILWEELLLPRYRQAIGGYNSISNRA
jgi:predicted PurR-regulated permease PerM